MTELPPTSPKPAPSALAAGLLMHLPAARRKRHTDRRESAFSEMVMGGRGASSPFSNPNVEGRAARKEAVMVRGCGIGGIIMVFGEDERCRWAVSGNWVQTECRRRTSVVEMAAFRSAVLHKSN